MYVHIGTMTTGQTVEEIEHKLGWKPGTAKKDKLIYPEGDAIGPTDRLKCKKDIKMSALGLSYLDEYYTFKD